MSEQRIIILGAGKIGIRIAQFLHFLGEYEITLADNNKALLKKQPFKTQVIDVNDTQQLEVLLKAHTIVVSALAYQFNVKVAKAALKTGVSYFDLTEDVTTTDNIFKLAQKAKKRQVFVPQCGLAPGFISILAYDMALGFEHVDSLKLRVGALPQFPSNQIMYNLTWSTEGLINEYCNPCRAIVQGEETALQSLDGVESFSLDGVEYEAFNTSGGLGSLCHTLRDKVDNLTYKTVRYPGHQYLMHFLIRELRLGEQDRRHLLKEILETSIPITRQDVVLIFVTVSGQHDGHLKQRSDVRKIYHQALFGENWSSIQITTAASLCAVVDLFCEGVLPQQGFIQQEQVPLKAFLDNRFGRYLAKQSGAPHET